MNTEPLDPLGEIESGEPPYIYPTRYPLMLPGRYPGLLIDSETAWLWFQLDEDLTPELLTVEPEPGVDNSVFWELRQDGSAYSLLHWGDYGNSDEVTQALENGLTYHQPFLAEVYVHYSKSGGYYEPEEWDCDIQSKILFITKLPLETVIARWEEWINR